MILQCDLYGRHGGALNTLYLVKVVLVELTDEAGKIRMLEHAW